MKKFSVSVPVGAVVNIEVEARTKKEALEKALSEEGVPTLCHHCSNHVELGDFYDEHEAIVYPQQGEEE